MVNRVNYSFYEYYCSKTYIWALCSSHQRLKLTESDQIRPNLPIIKIWPNPVFHAKKIKMNYNHLSQGTDGARCKRFISRQRIKIFWFCKKFLVPHNEGYNIHERFWPWTPCPLKCTSPDNHWFYPWFSHLGQGWGQGFETSYTMQDQPPKSAGGPREVASVCVVIT